MQDETAQLVIDEPLNWRCGNPQCPVKPILGQLGLVGGVYVRISGRSSNTRHIVMNVLHSTVKQHCPVCHSWRELYYDVDEQSMKERAATGYIPLVGCECEFAHYAKGSVKHG